MELLSSTYGVFSEGRENNNKFVSAIWHRAFLDKSLNGWNTCENANDSLVCENKMKLQIWELEQKTKAIHKNYKQRKM